MLDTSKIIESAKGRENPEFQSGGGGPGIFLAFELLFARGAGRWLFYSHSEKKEVMQPASPPYAPCCTAKEIASNVYAQVDLLFCWPHMLYDLQKLVRDLLKPVAYIMLGMTCRVEWQKFQTAKKWHDELLFCLTLDADGDKRSRHMLMARVDWARKNTTRLVNPRIAGITSKSGQYIMEAACYRHDSDMYRFLTEAPFTIGQLCPALHTLDIKLVFKPPVIPLHNDRETIFERFARSHVVEGHALHRSTSLCWWHLIAGGRFDPITTADFCNTLVKNSKVARFDDCQFIAGLCISYNNAKHLQLISHLFADVYYPHVSLYMFKSSTDSDLCYPKYHGSLLNPLSFYWDMRDAFKEAIYIARLDDGQSSVKNLLSRWHVICLNRELQTDPNMTDAKLVERFNDLMNFPLLLPIQKLTLEQIRFTRPI